VGQKNKIGVFFGFFIFWRGVDKMAQAFFKKFFIFFSPKLFLGGRGLFFLNLKKFLKKKNFFLWGRLSKGPEARGGGFPMRFF